MWWDNAVIYQVYLRSFQDSDGDGVGDLPGATTRLEHIAKLGAAAVWLSPVYPSPNYDFGYDVSDYQAIDPAFGTLDDFDTLVARAHELGLKVVLDYVPCHTSIEHPWFREHPEYYVWADEIPNNWRAAFGGPAWEHDPQSGRYFLSSFFPEQADLNWRNPDVRAAMGDALRFWVDRGVDGFRVDALDRIMKDPELRDEPPASGPPPLPLDPKDAELEHLYSRNAPDVGIALEAIRNAVGNTLLIGEVFLPTAQLGPYLEYLDVCFSFETLFAGDDASALTGGDRRGGQRRRHGVGALQPRLRPPGHPGRPQRSRSDPAAAHAARAGVHLPGRRTRDDQHRPVRGRPGPPRPRQPAHADALGRERPRRVHHRHPVAGHR